MNVNLCDELGANIYSFPMKYHPIDDPDYFRNRDFIGKHWNRKFIRAVQAILNSTKGKVGRGRDFLKKLLDKMLMNSINYYGCQRHLSFTGESMMLS